MNDSIVVVSFKIEESVVRDMDSVAGSFDMTRSEFIRTVISQGIYEGVDASYLSKRPRQDGDSLWDRQEELWPLYIDMMGDDVA